MSKHRKPKAKPAKRDMIADQTLTRVRRARGITEHVLLSQSWTHHVRTAAFLAAHPTAETRLTQHADRCDADLIVGLLLAREWSLDATGTGTTSGVADPTGNAATAGHRNLHTALVALISAGIEARTVKEVMRTADLIDRCLDHLDIKNDRNATAFDRETLHRENTCRGVCARCGRWCEGTRSKTLADGTHQREDRLKEVEHHMLCDTCSKSWRRRTDRQVPIIEWIGEGT